MTRRYVTPIVALMVTIGVILVLVFHPDAPGGLLIIAAIGPPVTALLLAAAASGYEAGPGKAIGAVVLGATIVPALVMLLHGLVAGAVWVLVGPLAEAGRDAFDLLDGDPTLSRLLTNPWAIAFLVQLAVVAPVLEEALKPLGAAVWRPGSRHEAFVLGAAAGAGFAAVENVLYASGWFFSNEAWLPISLLRASGAALHLLGAGLIAVALFERRSGISPRLSVPKAYGIATGLHALWNGTIAVAILLFQERELVAGGLGGDSLSWGASLEVVLVGFGILMMGGIVAAGRWAASDRGATGPFGAVSFDRPSVVAGWAAIGVLMLVPVTVLVLVFPGYLAL